MREQVREDSRLVRFRLLGGDDAALSFAFELVGSHGHLFNEVEIRTCHVDTARQTLSNRSVDGPDCEPIAG